MGPPRGLVPKANSFTLWINDDLVPLKTRIPHRMFVFDKLGMIEIVAFLTPVRKHNIKS